MAILADKCSQCDTVVIALDGKDKWCCCCGKKLEGNYVKVEAAVDIEGKLTALYVEEETKHE